LGLVRRENATINLDIALSIVAALQHLAEIKDNTTAFLDYLAL
jgi:hypothetical protein